MELFDMVSSMYTFVYTVHGCYLTLYNRDNHIVNHVDRFDPCNTDEIYRKVHYKIEIKYSACR